MHGVGTLLCCLALRRWSLWVVSCKFLHLISCKGMLSWHLNWWCTSFQVLLEWTSNKLTHSRLWERISLSNQCLWLVNSPWPWVWPVFIHLFSGLGPICFWLLCNLGEGWQAHKLAFFEELPTLLGMQPSTVAAAVLVSMQYLYSGWEHSASCQMWGQLVQVILLSACSLLCELLV